MKILAEYSKLQEIIYGVEDRTELQFDDHTVINETNQNNATKQGKIWVDVFWT